MKDEYKGEYNHTVKDEYKGEYNHTVKDEYSGFARETISQASGQHRLHDPEQNQKRILVAGTPMYS